MFKCCYCPVCSYDPQTNCYIYNKMIKQMAEAEKQKPKRKAHKKKTQAFDKELLKEWAIAVKERDGYVCTVCGIDDGRKVHAHHKLSKSKHPELAYNVSNGATVCVSCHSWVHGVDLEKGLNYKPMVHDAMDDYYTNMDEEDFAS